MRDSRTHLFAVHHSWSTAVASTSAPPLVATVHTFTAGPAQPPIFLAHHAPDAPPPPTHPPHTHTSSGCVHQHEPEDQGAGAPCRANHHLHLLQRGADSADRLCTGGWPDSTGQAGGRVLAWRSGAGSGPRWRQPASCALSTPHPPTPHHPPTTHTAPRPLQVPDVNVWYGPDTYMGRNLAQLFQSLANLR